MRASGLPGRKTGPSIQDVARLAGVSAQTVSRVSTGSQPVRPETRRMVLEAMDQLGYSPNRAARALRDGTFGTVGILAHRYDRTGAALTTAAVVEAAEARGYAVSLVSITTPDADHWEQGAHRISHQAIDGLIIIRAETATPNTLTLPAGMPVVVSDSRLIGHYPAVTADQLGGSAVATQHLLDLGHTTVHHVAGPEDSEPAFIRKSSWRRTLEMAGIPAPEPWQGDWTPRSGYEAGKEIAADPSVTAVYSANDEMAFGLILALHEAGRRVPEDVSVVGFDGIPLGEFSHPPLTTIRQDFQRIGRELVDLLLAQIRGRGTGYVPAERTVVPTELVLRSTTAPPPA
ncbi:LacI family DNA-binding transcriptional regulator [Tessaracoccus sp. OS52]|uniref:LacI family DNA-binding transcriptional regulator n=1 Tax=Tessaracoccus sp. OS52 TaxID=2886691 RepID=UPI001D0F51CB|nr:LacI family DNA-binding transcriptional regulator [Tessaracoccus sp. OS52]MCC2594471.1 LacI family DNA-binding transcriptional regulator [Tessaracoccus sp. OS52]